MLTTSKSAGISRKWSHKATECRRRIGDISGASGGRIGPEPYDKTNPSRGIRRFAKSPIRSITPTGDDGDFAKRRPGTLKTNAGLSKQCCGAQELVYTKWLKQRDLKQTTSRLSKAKTQFTWAKGGGSSSLRDKQKLATKPNTLGGHGDRNKFTFRRQDLGGHAGPVAPA